MSREDLDNMPKPKVLFLCTGNAARIQMAEGLLRAPAGEQFEIFSAGTQSKGGILPEVQEVMREAGVDISAQCSKSVTEYLRKVNFGYVVTLCADAEANCRQSFSAWDSRILALL
jgi:arsenate reductase (thioredoxin)